MSTKRAGRWLLRKTFRLALTAVKKFVTLIPAVVLADSRAGMAGSKYGKAEVWASTGIWATILPVMLWNMQGVFPWLLVLLPVELAAAFYLVSRRFAADKGQHLSIRNLRAGLRELTTSGQATTAEDGTVTKKSIRPWFVVQLVGLGVVAFGAILWLAGPVAFIRDAVATVPGLVVVQPSAHLIVLAGFLVLCSVGCRVGFVVGLDQRGKADVELLWGAQLASIFSISLNDWLTGSGSFEFSEDNTKLTVTNVPVLARLKLGSLESRCEQVAPGWTVTSVAFDRVEFTSVELLPDVAARRLAMSFSNGMINGVRQGVSTALRPNLMIWSVSPDARANASAINNLAVEQGLRLVELHEARGEAYVSAISPQTVRARARLAQLMNKYEHEVELLLNYEDGHIQTVDVVRFPVLSLDAEKREGMWKSLLLSLEGGNNGWAISDNPITGHVRLTYGLPRKLESTVPLKELMPARVTPEDWYRIPIGRGEDGGVVSLDLTIGPHSLIAGTVGSGKSILLATIAVGALARGHMLAVIDPTKSGLDFTSLKPYATVWSVSGLAHAQSTILAIYAESARRKGVLISEGEVKTADLSEEQRTRHGIKPILVIVDEMSSLVTLEDVPKGLQKSDPLMVDAEARNSSRAVIKSTIARIARESRFTQISLAIGIQRPDASFLGGELRSNLASAVQMSAPGKTPSREALGMVLSADGAHSAIETFAALDDGFSKGLGVVASDGGEVLGLRVAYANAKDLPSLLAAAGVQEIETPWVIEEAKTAVWARPVPSAAVAAAAAVEPEFRVLPSPSSSDDEVVDMGEVTVNFDDLLAAADAADAAAAAASASGYHFTFDD